MDGRTQAERMGAIVEALADSSTIYELAEDLGKVFEGTARKVHLLPLPGAPGGIDRLVVGDGEPGEDGVVAILERRDTWELSEPGEWLDPAMIAYVLAFMGDATGTPDPEPVIVECSGCRVATVRALLVGGKCEGCRDDEAYHRTWPGACS